MLGKVIIDHCSQCDCGEKRPIVNKRHMLCDHKNKVRLGTDSKKEKHRGLLITKTTFKPNKKRLGLSKKKIKKNNEYAIVCREIGEERGMLCQGCNTHERLSFSHLVPRSRNEDLIAVKINIHIHCMDGDGIEGCHTKCEAGKFDELNDGKQIIKALKQLDPEYLRLKLMKK